MAVTSKTLREIADQSGYRPAWVAGKLGVTYAYYRMILVGERPLPDWAAEAMATLFGVSVQELRGLSARARKSYKERRATK